MEIVHPRCCGIDVHKASVVACVRIQETRRARTEIRRFGTTTAELLELHRWLSEASCTHVAIESTSIYWKPVFNVLEGSFEVVLANAYHVKAVPGRKTDVKDCEWLADLLAHGLIRASFIPPPEIRALRDLTRHRKSLLRDRVAAVNRVHKLLESANIKMANVMTDVMGVSGRAMLDALGAGERDAHTLSQLARGCLVPRIPALAQALRGTFTDHHAFLLRQILTQADQLTTLITACDQRIGELMTPHTDALRRLQAIPGVGRRSVEVLISEIGVEMSRFASAGHLASWARICPGTYESAGKRRGTSTGAGNNWLRTTLLESAWAASHSKKSYLGCQFRRVAKRRGPKRAAIAVAHSILVIAYYMLRDAREYQDLGPHYFDRVNVTKLRRYHLRRLADLGCDVSALADSA
jgi:transposase